MRRADPRLAELERNDRQAEGLDRLFGRPLGEWRARWQGRRRLHGRILRSAGTEATLLQLLHLLFAHGMLVVGLPWSERMRVSGSYYGATAHGQVPEDDREQARSLGRRVAETAVR